MCVKGWKVGGVQKRGGATRERREKKGGREGREGKRGKKKGEEGGKGRKEGREKEGKVQIYRESQFLAIKKKKNEYMGK